MSFLLIFLIEFIFLFILSRIVVKNLLELLLRITQNKNIIIRLFHFLFLPGVVIHELAHLITAETMFVKTGGLSFTPSPDEDKIMMGSVGIEKTDPIRRAVIGFAPIFVGFSLIAFSIFYFFSEKSPILPPWNYILVFFIVFEIGNTMFSSKKDLEGTVQLMIILCAIFIAGFILGLRVPDWIISFLDSEAFVEIIKKGNWILLFPITVDLGLIAFVKFLKKN